MKFYDKITKNTLNDEINRICGVTDEVYSLRDKIARVNQALDKYWYLASQSAPRGNFDDVNHTSVPVETQSLVAGTNAYKISSFTNEVLEILKVSALDEDAKEMDLYREEFEHLDDFVELYTTDTGDRGTPQYWTKMGDYIYIRPAPDYAETNGLRCYANREMSKFAYETFTTTHASETINATAHGLSDGDTVILSTAGVIPTGYTADTQVYYVRDKATDTFKVATSHTGTAVTITDDGTGLHQFVEISKTPGIPVIHHDYLARHASLPFLIEKKLPHAGNVAQQIFLDEQAIMDYWRNRGKELETTIKTKKRRFK